MTKPPIMTTTKLLPFDQLGPDEFETLCLWLVSYEGYEEPEHFGAAGSDQGRDVVALKSIGSGKQLWYFQCKRTKEIGAQQLKNEVDKITRLSIKDPTKQPFGIVFVTSALISAKTRDQVEAYCHEHSYACEFWAHTELDMRVNRHEKIVQKFFYAHSISRQSALHQLRPSSRNFVGREKELTEVRGDLESGFTIFGVQGMPGVGKTELALRLAEEFQGHYDAQLFLDLKGFTEGQKPVTPAEAIAQVIRAYYPDFRMPFSEDELRGHYLSVLHGKSTLIVLDNVRDEKQVEKLVPPTSIGTTWLMIVTSRNQLYLDGMRQIDLNVLSLEEAETLLKSIAPRIGGHAAEIAQLCGYLPLALQTAASTLNTRGRDLTPPEYAQRLKGAKKRLELVAASLNVSYDLLDESLQWRWRALSVFPGSFEEGAAAAIWQVPLGDEAKDTLGELLAASLVGYDEAARRYRLHDLLRDFAAMRLSNNESEALQLRHAQHYCGVLYQASDLYRAGGEKVKQGLARYDRERNNIEKGQAWAESSADKHSAALQLCVDYPHAGHHFLDLRLHPNVMIHWLEVQLNSAQRLKRLDREGFALGKLGTAYHDLGEARKAIGYHEQSLLIDRKLSDRHNEGRSLSNLGLAYDSLGEPRKAIELYEKALVISREMGDRSGQGNALSNLGLAHYHLGETRQAIKFYNQALVVLREIGDRRGESIALNNLGIAYYSLSETRKAIELHEEALAISHEIGDRSGQGNALGNLGSAYQHSGETQRAIEFYEQHLTIAREIGDRSGEGVALNNLGITYHFSGDARKAIGFHEEALAIGREIDDRRGESAALDNLGIAYCTLGEIHKAIEFHKEALAISREIGDQRGEGNMLSNLGLAYYHLGETHKAVEFYDQALIVLREIGDRRAESRVLDNLSVVYDSLGETPKAIEFYDQALIVLREIGDRRAESMALNNLGIAYHSLGETRKAIKFQEEALAISREIGDQRGEGIALNNLSVALYSLGEIRKAIEFHRQAKTLQERTCDKIGSRD